MNRETAFQKKNDMIKYVSQDPFLKPDTRIDHLLRTETHVIPNAMYYSVFNTKCYDLIHGIRYHWLRATASYLIPLDQLVSEY